jgi:hypothetical protein
MARWGEERQGILKGIFAIICPDLQVGEYLYQISFKVHYFENSKFLKSLQLQEKTKALL